MTWHTLFSVPCRHSCRHRVDRNVDARPSNKLPGKKTIRSQPFLRSRKKRSFRELPGAAPAGTPILIRTPRRSGTTHKSAGTATTNASRKTAPFPKSAILVTDFEKNSVFSINSSTACTLDYPFPRAIVRTEGGGRVPAWIKNPAHRLQASKVHDLVRQKGNT